MHGMRMPYDRVRLARAVPQAGRETEPAKGAARLTRTGKDCTMETRNQLYAAMREWLEDIEHLRNADRVRDSRVYEIVDRLYDGGVDQFILDSDSGQY